MNNVDIFRKLQQLARSVQAIRSPLDRIIELAWRGEEKPNKEEIIHVLRSAVAQQELAVSWETLLYRHTSGQYVLVTTALPDNASDAKVLATRRLINSREACSYCGLVEGSYAPIELVVANNPVGVQIQGERVHPRCALYWQRLKLIAEGR